MWRTALPRIIPTVLQTERIELQQIRTTFIVKRRWPPGLHKTGGKPKPLRGRHYVYDLVKDTNTEKQPSLDLILVSYVAGYGNPGDKITLAPGEAYEKLLLPRLAVYATPENIETYANKSTEEKKVEYSSPFVQRTIDTLSRILLSVAMNMKIPWTLEKWHVSASFRKTGFIVPEDAIQLPAKPISGPDFNLQNKDFYVTVTINNLETCNVRCRIHHYSPLESEKLPFEEEYWKKSSEPVFLEDAPILATIPTRFLNDNTAEKSS